MKEEYKDLDLNRRIELAKELFLNYISDLIDTYEWKTATKEELKKELPYSKKPLEAVCKTMEREILLGPFNNGYNQLRIILHEILEIICCDTDSLDNKILRYGEVRKFKHDKFDSIVKDIIKIYKNS